MSEEPLDATTNPTSKTLGERFDEVEQGFLDQRDYTTFCFDKLRQKIKQSESRLARRLDREDLVLGAILTEVKAKRRADRPI